MGRIEYAKRLKERIKEESEMLLGSEESLSQLVEAAKQANIAIGELRLSISERKADLKELQSRLDGLETCWQMNGDIEALEAIEDDPVLAEYRKNNPGMIIGRI